MTHIAFINMAAHGHVNPTLALVKELVARGVRVSYATPLEFAAIVSRAGAEPKVYQTQFEVPKSFPFPPESKDIAVMPTKLLEEAEFVIPQLEALYREDHPDLVCYDFMATAGRLFAQKLKIPAVRLHPSYASNETFSLARRFLKIDPHEPGFVAYGEKLAGVLRDNGLPILSPLAFMQETEDRNLVFLPRSFQYEGDSFDERFEFVGPCLRATEDEGSWQPKNPALPTLLISLGTVFNNWPEFFKIALEAFRGDEWNVVMAIGANVDRETLGPIPENFEVRAHIPQLDVLKTAKVFITHGGMNSTMEALYHEVPLVVIPQMIEQMATAERVRELNLGHYLPRPEVTVETLRLAVDAVKEAKGLRENIARMSADVRNAGGARRAADTVLAYAAVPPTIESYQ